MQGIKPLFVHPRPIIGVVHLAPLPGSPRCADTMRHITTLAVLDAEILADNGIDGIIVENYGDTPFLPGFTGAHTVAAMAVVVHELRSRLPDLPIGVNILRNDAASALAVAAAAGANFIRVNVHTGAMLTDQGIVEGRAGETLRYRAQLGCDVRIFADIAVKHATPLAPVDLPASAHDTYHRGMADALIVTGAATGVLTAPDDLRRVREAVPEAPVFAGSGVTADTLADVLRHADGVIVGTTLKRDGITSNAVDAERVRAFVNARTGG